MRRPIIDPIRGYQASYVRLFVLAPILILAFGLTFVPRLTRFNQLYLSATAVGMVTCLLWMLVILDNEKGHGLSSSMGLSNVTLAIIFIYSVTTIRFLYASLASARTPTCSSTRRTRRSGASKADPLQSRERWQARSQR